MAQRSASRSRRDKDDTNNPDFVLPGIGNYVFQKTVGEGNFAKVKLATHKLTGQEVAIKVIDKTQLDEKKLGKLYREVRIMKLLHHPNIIKLYEVVETKYTVFLVMEYASGGELYDYLVVHGKMKEKEARAKFRQILSAVSYCHKKRVIHRDLKAENLLLDSNLNIKIADFGFSNHFDPDGKLDTFCGSPPYAAPELFQGRQYTGPEVDVWSLGVILYVLTTGCLPFDGKNLQEMRESVCRGKYRIPFYLSDNCEKLLRKFLVRDPSKRHSLDILTDDPWINESFDTSPISTDISETVEEDEAILKLVETKFKVDKEVILKYLRDGSYNDVAALYYLLYYEKQSGRAPSVTPDSADITQASPTRKEKSTSPANPNMIKIEEDAVLPTPETTGEQQRPNTVAVAKAARRKRAATVAGGKPEDDEEKPEPVKPLDDPKPIRPHTAVPNPQILAVQHTHEPQEEKTAQSASAATPPTDAGKDVQSRKRTNTIVGIFKRRPSESDTASGSGPVTEDANKPRSLRFTFNSNTTSSKNPDEIIQEVIRNCNLKSITHRLLSRYLLECTYAPPASKEPVKFEVEVCKLPRLNNLHGLRFKRLSGQSQDYKEVCELLLAAVQL